ncbi:uncharacterized protein LOC113355297 isoform X2 [Papaver somniferum]|uniref:uncharacterized protein LOC113355297 isoform X2 n=1 Tax=Papaver somniferum TaxID=3469 RepID=UPI000E701D3D|nr:uncharacterized protein LOC113355297 isoform X2 [Papaver somniferum]
MERAKWMCNLGSRLAGSVQAICSHPQNIHEDEKDVLSASKSFPKGTSCGRDGLRAQHLLDAFSGTAAEISDDLLHSIVGVVNLWLSVSFVSWGLPVWCRNSLRWQRHSARCQQTAGVKRTLCSSHYVVN